MKKFDTINVIPFIDIMLVLLAIVLTTASFVSQNRLDLELPAALLPAVTAQHTGIELAIDQAQALYYNDEPIEFDVLEQRLRELDTTTPIVFRVDSGVAFRRFVAVVDVLQRYQLNSLSILTHDAR